MRKNEAVDTNLMWLSFFFARSSSKKNSNPVANTDSIITAHGDDLTAICSIRRFMYIFGFRLAVDFKCALANCTKV